MLKISLSPEECKYFRNASMPSGNQNITIIRQNLIGSINSIVQVTCCENGQYYTQECYITNIKKVWDKYQIDLKLV